MSNSSRVLEIILRAKDEASKVLDGVSKSVGESNAKLAAAGVALAAGGIAIGKGLDDATSKAQAYVGSVRTIQRATGMSAEESSKMQAVFARMGIEGKASTGILKALSVAVAGNSKDLAAAGIATQDATGKSRDMSLVIADLADYYAKADDKTQAVALASKVLGKNWAAILPVLAGGSDAINKITDSAEKNNLVFSQADLDKAGKYAAAQKDLAASTDALKIQVGLANIPLEKFKVEMMQGIIDKVMALSPQLVPLATGILQVGEAGGKTAGSTLTTIAMLKIAFPGLLAGIGTWFATMGTTIGGFFSGIAFYIEWFVTVTLPGLIAAVPAMLASFAAWVAGLTGAAAVAALALAVGLGVALGAAINWLLQKIPGYQAWWNRLVDWFIDVLPGKLGAAVSAIGAWVAKGVTAAVDSMKKLPGLMLAAIIGLADTLRAPIDKALAQVNRLNPFMRHSPSLVDNVLAGVGVIGGAYAGLGGLRVAPPSLAGISAGGTYGAQPGGSGAIHVYLDGRELNRGLAVTSVGQSRSGAR